MEKEFSQSLDKSKILITGFEPFLDHKVNPSKELALYMKNLGYSVLIFPVSYKEVTSQLEKLDLESFSFILMLGLALERQSVCLERVAINWIESSSEDSLGNKPEPQKIDSMKEDAIINQLPLQEIVKNCKAKASFTIKISHSAGAYVCNYLYFKILKHTSRALFVHLPESINIKEASELVECIVKQTVKSF
ncbi:MAG: hypothetical protein KDD45_07250 [Bdellovibrionales bacterium]|nr:hypothetical protein [Bdellovibrionales bacterium]